MVKSSFNPGFSSARAHAAIIAVLSSALGLLVTICILAADAQSGSTLKGFVKRAQASGNNVNDDATFAEAVALYNSGDYNSARLCFWRLSQETPGDYKTQYYLANSFFQLKDFPNAQIWYDRCLSSHPDADTRQNCLKAIAFLKKPTAASASGDAPVVKSASPQGASLLSYPSVNLQEHRRFKQTPAGFIKFQNDDQNTRSSVSLLVKSGLDTIPDSLLKKMDGDGYSILITPTILDAMPRMSARTPRGYGDDSNYDNAAALFRTESRQIVVAERFQLRKNSSDYMPNDFAESAVRHEFGHAVDCDAGYPSRSDAFKTAYGKDEKALSGFDRNRFAYFLQSGDAGRSELFAELFSAKYCPDNRKTRQMTDLIKAFSDVAPLMNSY